MISLRHCLHSVVAMRRLRTDFYCTVIIPLSKRSVLEIGTSVSHALEIISGETILPAKQTKVIDADGNPLTKNDLLRLRDSEQ